MTGDLKSKIDSVWNAFWSGGISNPLEVIGQITYLLFIRRLEELHTLAENKASTTRRPIENSIFDGSTDPRRWKNLREVGPLEMFTTALYESPFTKLAPLGPDSLCSGADDELVGVLDAVRATTQATDWVA